MYAYDGIDIVMQICNAVRFASLMVHLHGKQFRNIMFHLVSPAQSQPLLKHLLTFRRLISHLMRMLFWYMKLCHQMTPI